MPQHKENIRTIFKGLHAAIGVSGQEQEVIQEIYRQLEGHADEVHVSNTGNVVAVKKGKSPGPSLAVAAHMDEVGYMVRNILPDGFLLIDKIGFPTDACATGRKVWVSAKRIPGIIGIKPGHLQTPEEAKLVTPASKSYVDLGCKSAGEVKALGIKIGDQVIIQSDFMEMSNPDLICTRAVDNRINCAVIIDLFQSLNAGDFCGTIHGVFTVREEVGMLGAANAIAPYDVDYVISLDTVPCADTPGSNPAVDLPIYLGNGPALVICETAGMNFQLVHPALRRILESSAEKTGVNLQTVSMAFASYITDASAYAYAKNGLPTATFACPRRYSHSPVELVDLNDAAGISKVLLQVAAENGNADLSFVALT